MKFIIFSSDRTINASVIRTCLRTLAKIKS